MPLQELQRTIDESIAASSGLSRVLFGSEPWTASQVQDYTNQKGSLTVATIDREGRPHAAIVAAGCVDGVFYIGVTPRTALLGNLRRSESVAFTIGGSVTGRGSATLSGRASDLKAIAGSLPGILQDAVEQDWNGYFYTITPTRIFATGPES